MSILTRAVCAVLLGGSLSGCLGIVPALIAPQVVATVGVATLSAATCARDSSCEPEPPRCMDSAGKRIEVTETPDVAIPANEGKVAEFAPAYWESPFESQGTARTTRSAAPAPGTLAITDRSAIYVPPSGMDGVHIPLPGVVNIEMQTNATTGAARQITIESCFGRLDRFTFGRKEQPGRLDSEATLAVADEISARVAALRGEHEGKGDGSRP